MNVILHRTDTNEDGTFGTLNVDGQPVCVTLEETWLDNQRRISCIPEGEYECVKYSGTKYKNVWWVKNVKDRSAILIHWGNTERNTAGCILVGKYYHQFGEQWGIADSKRTFRYLKKTLPDNFTLKIINHF